MPGVEGDAVNAPLGFVGSGSWRPPKRRQPLVLGLVNFGSTAASEKSPVRSKGVGTNCGLAILPRISRFHSSEAKKKILSFFTGRPTLASMSFRRTEFFFAVG